MLPESIQKFVALFSRMPGLGPRAATRLAFYISNLEKEKLYAISEIFENFKKINRCKKCFFIKDSSEPFCRFCADKSRDNKTIAIVERETDLLSLEKSGVFNGVYFLIGDLSDKDIIESFQKMRLQYLKNRIIEELASRANEIIVALSPTAISDILYEMIKDEFKNIAGKISRLGRGIPTGGEIEFADETTLKNALERRN